MFAGANSSHAADETLAALPAPIPISPVATTTATTTTTTPTATTAPIVTQASVAPTTLSPTSTVAVVAPVIQAFNGDRVDTRYGPVEIQVQFTDGAITEVAVVTYPDNDGKSVRINARALPTLRTEALTVQSAEIDTVSGATYTSDAYARSLQSAIDQARAAGVTTLA
jgi:uncharacterized protein with FMN-binding domain